MTTPGDWHGPPLKTGKGNPLVGTSRLTTTPKAPSSVWARRNTTVCAKFGSLRFDLATKNEQASDMASVPGKDNIFGPSCRREDDREPLPIVSGMDGGITVYAGISCTRDALAECFLLPSLLWREGFGAEGLALGKFPLSLNPSPPSTG